MSSRNKCLSVHSKEQGIVVILVAVVMLFVIGAMAALAIDVVTIYTARSEAQLAADGAALAAARVLANSGMTSDLNADKDGLQTASRLLAVKVATQVAQQNLVGGGSPTVLAPVFGGSLSNPTVTVRVQRTDLPTFFARIFGRDQIAVSASATAEAYNPSGPNVGVTTPVALMCVKPWLLPNIDPSNTAAPGSPIFDPQTGAIQTGTLLGSTSTPGTPLKTACVDCTTLPPPADTGWQFYPGDPADKFVPPTQSLPSCTTPLNTPYELGIAGCIPVPISCNSTAAIDISNYPNRNRETERAANCLAHTRNSQGDRLDITGGPNQPFQFLAGDDNPIPGLSGAVVVSDSLVTVPVFDVGPPIGPGPTFAAPTNPVQIIGFVQLFLSPDGTATPRFGPTRGQMTTAVINLAGCGTRATGNPAIRGNGASPVAVRLISS
jgi:Putative Flp pilus-assembly TadE/G-like